MDKDNEYEEIIEKIDRIFNDNNSIIYEEKTVFKPICSNENRKTSFPKDNLKKEETIYLSRNKSFDNNARLIFRIGKTKIYYKKNNN